MGSSNVSGMKTTLASRRFKKTWFDTKNDWASHPPAVYICPSCLGETRLTLGDLESAVDRQSQPELQTHLLSLRDACSWVWRDKVQLVYPFRCSGCDRQVLLGFERSRFRRTGHMFRLGMVGEEPELSGGSSSNSESHTREVLK